ncbi:MAG: CDP-diacylglycerol--glycerol-3-phosphate 3-phosphatidyltransferase, partial [Deltaproteobacteria bacterium]|nr:CDP-diacylglycerol--glycerol-3-phosphate 3-phosphatidyltransferase [Deltaproteobacteria bacterium]
VSRDFFILLGISILFMVSVPFEIRPTFVSKLTTAAQIITVFLALAIKALGVDGHPLFIHFLHWLTAGFTVVSGFHYIFRGVKAINHS